MKSKLTLALSLALLLACLVTGTATAEVVSKNPLLTPPEITEYTKTEDTFVNILLLGIDYGGDTYDTSGGKHKLEDCHTDGVVVVSLNQTKGTAHLVSIPRDSLTYVPGIKGIYKFNAAINCADTMDEGFKLACDAASWHLGGIEINKYIAVDATALAALGDAIGGIDFDVEARFGDTRGRWYDAGMQHLDGIGIMSYMRARKGITENYTDLGRTNRQREMLKAIFNKIKANPSLLTDILALYTSGELNIFTNIGMLDALKLAPTVLSMDLGGISSHVLTGPYKTFMKNFTFNEQENRLQVIKTVYGLDAEPMQYVSYEYTRWLTEAGLTTAKYINMGRAVLAFGKENGLTETAEYKALDEAIDACVLAFDEAADSMGDQDTKDMVYLRNKMKPAVEKAAKAFKYPTDIEWGRNSYWYREPMINERQLEWG